MEDLLPDTKKLLEAIEEFIWSKVKAFSPEQMYAFKIHLIAWISENL